jgi:hypothetical protein
VRAEYWGQPRDWIAALGPENAWHYGDDWQAVLSREHYDHVTRQELVAELEKIYRGIKAMDPKECAENTWEKTFGFDYLTMTDWPGMYQWWWNVIKEHPLEAVEYGELTRNKDGQPQIEVTTTLQGGLHFSKTFAFKYLAAQQRWQVQYGLDLHLDPQWKNLPKTKKESPQ